MPDRCFERLFQNVSSCHQRLSILWLKTGHARTRADTGCSGLGSFCKNPGDILPLDKKAPDG